MRVKAALALTFLLAGCGSAPPASQDPPRLKAALEAESDGARRYARGELSGAGRRFDEAARLFAAIDDNLGVARNRLHGARVELARGEAEAALRAVADAERRSGGMDIDSLLLGAQARIALGQRAEAQQSLVAAERLCHECPHRPGLRLLQGRLALAEGRAAEALARAEAALAEIKDIAGAEAGNAWRLAAAARLAAGDAVSAQPAAERALAIDRRLGAPEKIAGDWMLLGDIRRRNGNADAAAAYRRALDVAAAAGLAAVAARAEAALAGLDAGPGAVR